MNLYTFSQETSKWDNAGYRSSISDIILFLTFQPIAFTRVIRNDQSNRKLAFLSRHFSRGAHNTWESSTSDPEF